MMHALEQIMTRKMNGGQRFLVALSIIGGCAALALALLTVIKNIP
jgi:hypothetical protein